MAYVVSLADYYPPARYDNHPWTTAKIEESPAQDGPWTVIDTFSLTPVDTDPSQPQGRDFTSPNAQLESGWYRIVWSDASNNTFEGDPVPRDEVRDQNYAPSTDEVARLITSRTRDTFGNLLGVFTDDTLPTAEQVEAIIGDVITDVADVIGDQVPSALIDDAAHLVALRAAMQIELSYYAEQISNNRSPYNELKQHYDEDILQLSKQIQIVEEGGEVGAISSQPSLKAFGGFPDPATYPPYGLATRW